MLPRLKTAEQFAAVLDASKQRAMPDASSMAQPAGVWRSAHFVLHVAPYEALASADAQSASRSLGNASGSAKSCATVGVICPKRWAKRAVTRNTIKRQIYAVSSELAPQLPPACLVLRLASEFSREQFSSATSVALKGAIRAELLALFAKLIPAAGAQA